ncbi:hypothetical protein EUX98_g6816 [Antrodiella citrinella]|uniref:Zn(2)-C6 fungal-type domain-containing protein n=1 Tax=Antrodiella citrinella TaxID=2447956 RepID=A0A4S4MVI9_9APHY|nr:hypothetical protein EUX98_g6816 [Antrodiella citrinella]
MNGAWNQSQMPPQLEHEFLDHNNIVDVDQRYLSGQQLPSSQQAPFPPFNPSFAGRTPQDFAFHAQQPAQQPRIYDNSAYHYDQTLRDQPQGSGQYGAVPSTGFAPSATTTFQPSPTGLPTGDLRNQHGAYVYDDRAHDIAGLRPGMPMTNSSDSGVSSGGAVTQSLYMPSPPADQYGFSRQVSGSPGGSGFEMPQSNGQRQTGFFVGQEQFETKPDHFGINTANKRMRQDDSLDDFTAEQDAESKEPAKTKPLGACARCKGLKVRCEFKTDPDTCKRCLAGNHECIIPGRKKRRAPPKREHLLKQIQDQAGRIEELMRQLEAANKANAQPNSGLPSPALSSATDLFSAASASAPASEFNSSDADVGNDLLSDHMSKSSDVMDWIAKARESLQQFGGYINMGGPGEATRGLDDEGNEFDSVLGDENSFEFAVEDVDGEDRTEFGGDDYASGEEGTATHRRGSNTHSEASVRQLGATGRLPTDEVAPFGLFAKMSLMNRKHRSSRPSSEAGDEDEKTSQVGVPSNDYFKPSPAPERPIIDERQQHPHIFRNGVVRPDEVESLFKMSVFLSLNLDKPSTAKPKNEQHARELLNRTRTWLAVFNLDRSTGSQYGKPAVISNNDYLATHSGEWWNSSPYNMNGFDIHVAGYNADLREVASFWLKIRNNSNDPTGLNQDLNIAQVASDTDDRLAHLWETWIARIRQHDPNTAHSKFRNSLLRLAYSYARLTALAFGFQYDFAKNPHGNDSLLWRCLRAAKDVLHAYIDEVATEEHKIYVRHGPDAQSVFVTFASTFLIKLLQPKYTAFLTRDQRIEIRELIGRLIDVMEDIAVDERHCPMLYAKFLAGLLATPMASVDYKSPKKVFKAKSASPTTKRAELHNITLPGRGTASNPASARPSASPPPFSIDENGQVVAVDVNQQLPPISNELPAGFTNYFTPLPLEPEFLQSMQSLTDSASGWTHDSVLHGFHWMQAPDTEMDMSNLSMPMNGAMPY